MTREWMWTVEMRFGCCLPATGRLSRDARWYSRERNGPVKARKFHRKQEYRKIQNKREEAVAGREEG